MGGGDQVKHGVSLFHSVMCTVICFYLILSSPDKTLDLHTGYQSIGPIFLLVFSGCYFVQDTLQSYLCGDHLMYIHHGTTLLVYLITYILDFGSKWIVLTLLLLEPASVFIHLHFLFRRSRLIESICFCSYTLTRGALIIWFPLFWINWNDFMDRIISDQRAPYALRYNTGCGLCFVGIISIFLTSLTIMWNKRYRIVESFRHVFFCQAPREKVS